ncbi:MAG: 50S ribosomal protein L22 [Planctomycetota bacterium]
MSAVTGLFEVRAVHRYARMGPQKARRVVDMIRGLTANQALDLLRHDRHRAARDVRRVLASAVANALQNPEVRPNRLIVSKAFVGDGPLLPGGFRFRPGPQGRAMPIRKRTCHIHVHVADRGLRTSGHDGDRGDEPSAARTAAGGEGGEE